MYGNPSCGFRVSGCGLRVPSYGLLDDNSSKERDRGWEAIKLKAESSLVEWTSYSTGQAWLKAQIAQFKAHSCRD